jgi:hypothetical protein
MPLDSLRGTAGPLLSELLNAQSLEAQIVDFPQIEAAADAVMHRAVDLGDCLVWPVGAAAERVAGVVTARGRGAIDVGSWNTPVQGRRLLLVLIAAVSPLELNGAAEQLRLRGAAEIHACGIDVRDGDRAVGIASYWPFNTTTIVRPVDPAETVVHAPMEVTG